MRNPNNPDTERLYWFHKGYLAGQRAAIILKSVKPEILEELEVQKKMASYKPPKK